MSREAFLIIDAGSGGVKSFIVSPLGKILGQSRRPWNRESWKSDDAWRKIASSVSELLIDTEADIVSICSTGMREEFVLIDEEGKEVKYQLNEESMKFGDQLLEEYGIEMYTSSGHWPVPNWIAGSILPWLKESKPEIFHKVSSILMISDWINYNLTGEKATESTCACETSLFNLIKRDWDWKIIDSLGIDRSIFPKTLNNGEILGYTDSSFHHIIDIPDGVPVISGGADTQCGLLGMGTHLGEVGAVGGTTTPIQALIQRPILDGDRKTWTNNYLINDCWVIESNVGYTGRSMRWLNKELRSQQGYEKLISQAGEIPPGSNGLMTFLGPHLFDSGPPYWKNDKLSDLPVQPTIIGSYDFSVATLARAIMEANSYGVKLNLDYIEKISGLSFNYIKFCGGNSRSGTWMQIQADVLGVSLIVPEVHDASAIGAAVLAATGINLYTDIDEALSQMVRKGKTFEPRSEHTTKYKQHYSKWVITREKLGRL
jgi:autoinducer 2 (AI-2) kinase